MDVQTIVVAIIILSALLYVGAQIWRKTKSFSSNAAACASDCGCGSKVKDAKILVKN